MMRGEIVLADVDASVQSDVDRALRLLMEQLDAQPDSDAFRYWLFLSLEWIHRHRRTYDDPLEAVATIFAAFDYPAEMAPFVYWMPVEPGVELGPRAIEAKWQEYLERHRPGFAADKESNC